MCVYIYIYTQYQDRFALAGGVGESLAEAYGIGKSSADLRGNL